MKKIDEVTTQEVPQGSGMERFFQARLPAFKKTYFQSMGHLTPEQKEQKWQEFLPQLRQYFMTDPMIRRSYDQMAQSTVWRAPGVGEFESAAEKITSTLLGD
jgi:hypothetical protein